jgi:hypothetical protein
MTEAPRETPFWQQQVTLYQEAKRALERDALFQQDYRRAVEAFGHIVQAAQGVKFPLGLGESAALLEQTAQERQRFSASQVALVEGLLQRHPAMVHLFGTRLQEILTLWIFQAAGVEPDPTWGRTIERFLPNNPITRLPDGTYNIPPDLVEDRHYDQLREYIRSLRPARKRGPKVRSKPPKTPKPRRNKRDTVLSARAYDMFCDNVHWTQIWSRLFPEQRLPHDKKGRDAAYQKIRGFINNGRIRAYQKKGTAT